MSGPASRPVPGRAAVPVVIALVGLAVLTAVDGGRGAVLALLAAAVAASLATDVGLPQGGTIPMGHAVVIGVAAQLRDGAELAAVFALALALLAARRDGRRAGALAAGMAAAGATAVGLDRAVPDPSSTQELLGAFAVGGAYLGLDLLLTPRRMRTHVTLRSAGPVYVSLACSGALLALATGWLVVFAAFPLFITRFSFQRYAAARRTYDQTIQALGIVPELGGHVGLGHGERTAVYVDAIAGVLGLSPIERSNAVVAARLHHVGHVAVPDDTAEAPRVLAGVVAESSGRILRESGFLPEIAEIVESLGRVDPSSDSRLEAIVRAASDFDDLVGGDADRVRGALSILAGRPGNAAWDDAVRMLRHLVEDTDVVVAAIDGAAPLTAAAAAAGAAAE